MDKEAYKTSSSSWVIVIFNLRYKDILIF